MQCGKRRICPTWEVKNLLHSTKVWWVTSNLTPSLYNSKTQVTVLCISVSQSLIKKTHLLSKESLVAQFDSSLFGLITTLQSLKGRASANCTAIVLPGTWGETYKKSREKWDIVPLSVTLKLNWKKKKSKHLLNFKKIMEFFTTISIFESLRQYFSKHKKWILGLGIFT